jgi:hypothetical protein
MAKVYVVNEPLKYDEDRGEHVRHLNLRPARDHGELVFLLPAGQLPEDPRAVADAVERGLSGMTSEDFLLLVGDPRAIAIAGAVASRVCGGRFRLLHWQRDQRRYDPVDVDLGAAA